MKSKFTQKEIQNEIRNFGKSLENMGCAIVVAVEGPKNVEVLIGGSFETLGKLNAAVGATIFHEVGMKGIAHQ